MRRLLLLAFLIGLAAAPTAEARLERAAGPDSASLSLKDGSGEVWLSVRGTMLGRLERGRLVITDRPGRVETEITVTGDEVSREISEQTTEYLGRGIRFRVFYGAWVVRIEGEGINASVVARGLFSLKGESGTYALDAGPARRWPGELAVFTLGG